MKVTTRRLSRSAAVLCGCLMIVVSGCKDLNDNPPPVEVNRAVINIEELQAQMNANPGLQSEDASQSVAIADSDVSTAAKTLLIGAFLSTGNAAIPQDKEITTSISDFLGDNLTNSVEFLKLIQLPASSSYIEFKVPPQSAGNWQVGAFALSTEPETINQISDPEHKFSAVFAGTNSKYYSADDMGTTAIPLKIKRVCLMSSTPPKGCASFGSTLTANPVVTASVEIVGVRANLKDYTPKSVDFPIVVRTASDVTSAVTKLKTIRDEIKSSSTPSSLTVRVTHSQNTTESSACQALASATNNNEHTNTQLRTHCEVSDHTVYY